MNKDIQTPTKCGIFDVEMTRHFLLTNAPTINKQPTTNPLHITLLDWHAIASTHTCLLDILQLPITARIPCIVSDLAHASLISVKQFCYDGCSVDYDVTNCYIYFNNKITTKTKG